MNKNPACAHLLVGRLTEFAQRAQASLQNCLKFKMSFFGEKNKIKFILAQITRWNEIPNLIEYAQVVLP